MSEMEMKSGDEEGSRDVQMSIMGLTLFNTAGKNLTLVA
jgi:hypothetical protein